MIKSLKITNVALIPELTIEFFKGLNILSGETGAGKSVIADSLGFVLGEKAEMTLIRQGEETMKVEAVFDISGVAPAKKILEEQGVEYEDILLLKRTLSRSGKSDIFINGTHATTFMLKKITAALIDIYGQSEHSELLRPASHLEIIDIFASDIAEAKNKVAAIFAECKKIERELRSFGGDESARERQIDLLSFQIGEIEKAALKEGEEEELQSKRARIMNTEKILAGLKAARGYMESERGALEQLRLAGNALSASAAVDAEIEALRQRISSLKYEADDINESLGDITESLDYDQNTADKIENRLAEIRNIRKKYGADIAAVNKFLENAKKEYGRLTESEEIIAALNAQLEKLSKELHAASVVLSGKRRAAAKKLEEEIKTELNDLGLSGGGIETQFLETPPSISGIDKAEFLFSANKGEDLRPLAKIISGGEMSRFMLAVKTVTARIFSLPTMVFDEIDTGISGRIAEKVSVKLAAVSRAYQVISITHLPQIAAMGDANFLIEKSVQGEKTITNVKKLSPAEKVAEVARLSGGADITTTAHRHAEELIAWCDGVKIK